ncbi:MAG: hypothetical protein WDO12_02575 [Pseudomonadota bacterium]
MLCGSFDDGRDTFSAGDIDDADDTVQHTPVVSADAECICLVTSMRRCASTVAWRASSAGW